MQLSLFKLFTGQLEFQIESSFAVTHCHELKRNLLLRQLVFAFMKLICLTRVLLFISTALGMKFVRHNKIMFGGIKSILQIAQYVRYSRHRVITSTTLSSISVVKGDIQTATQFIKE